VEGEVPTLPDPLAVGEHVVRAPDAGPASLPSGVHVALHLGLGGALGAQVREEVLRLLPTLRSSRQEISGELVGVSAVEVGLVDEVHLGAGDDPGAQVGVHELHVRGVAVEGWRRRLGRGGAGGEDRRRWLGRAASHGEDGRWNGFGSR